MRIHCHHFVDPLASNLAIFNASRMLEHDRILEKVVTCSSISVYCENYVGEHFTC